MSQTLCEDATKQLPDDSAMDQDIPVSGSIPAIGRHNMAMKSEVVLKQKCSDGLEDGSETERSQPGVTTVTWNGANDPLHPQNWPEKKKWTIIVLVSVVTFNQAMSSTIFVPGVPNAMRDLHSDNSAVATLLVSIQVLGLAVGPIFLAPLSELYGRSPLVHATNVVFMITAVLAAVSVNVPMLLVWRLLMGACTISLGGGYVADMMKPEDRSRAMNVWTVGPVLAPVVGPIAGGFITLKASWRWTFALVATLSAFSLVVCAVFLPETYPPRILERKAARLRQTNGDDTLCVHTGDRAAKTPTQLIRLSILRPLNMLFRSPIVGILSIFLAIGYSYMYLMFATFTSLFASAYGFNAGEAGLAYLGMGVGSLIGQYGLDAFMKWHIRRQIARNGSLAPEDHLPPLALAGLFVSVGLLMYGWSMQYRVHWAVPITGTAVCGVGIMCFFLAVQTYLVEAYGVHAASALAASTLVRCIFGLTIPLAGPPLYNALGLGWGNTLLSLLALLVTPASLLLLKYGARIRAQGLH